MIRQIVILAALVLAAVSAGLYRFVTEPHLRMSPTTGALDIMITVTLVLIAAFIVFIIYRRTKNGGEK